MQLKRELARCRKLTRSGQHLEALTRLRRLVRKAKADEPPKALAAAAEQILDLYDHDTATDAFRKALRLARGDGEFALVIGYLLVRNQRFTTAHEFVEAARKKLPAEDIRPLLLLADISERLHRLDETRALAEEVLRINPDSVPARRLAATVARREARLDDALEYLKPLLTKRVPPHWESARAWYELGQIYDRRGEYENALDAWQKAKQHYPINAQGWELARRQAKFVREHSARVIDSLSESHVARWLSAAEELKSPRRFAVLSGHPRSGTTLLEQALDAHPDAISAEETTIFGDLVHSQIFEGMPADIPQVDLLDALEPRQITSFRHGYETLLHLALGEEPGERLLIDKNPDLLPILPTVLRVFPEARLVVALRDPRDILISIFSLPLPPNQNAVCHLDLESSARSVGQQLGLWVRLREKLPSPVLEPRYEDFVQDFRTSIGEVLDYLGLPWNDASANPSAHERQRVIQSPTYAAVREPIHTKAVGRWHNYAPWLEPHLGHLDEVVRALGYD